ncbi:MAG: glycosyltransferase family 87 protein [Myxococcota bacterium]
MNHFLSGILKLALLEGQAATLVTDRLLGERFVKGRRWAFVVFAALATFAWCNYGAFRGNGQLVHQWEQFHFYLGAKYIEEVGNFDLYKAVLLADRESARALVGLTTTRDLHTFEVIPVEQALEDAPRVRARFTDARWEELKRDWELLLRTPASWPNILNDHGNTSSPAWALLAHPLAELFSPTRAAQVFFACLDFALLIGLWWFAFRTFGTQLAAVALTVFASVPIWFDYLAGSFLRQDWTFAIGMALCFLHKKRYATAGAFFGFAVATKLFPLFFGVALLLRALLEVVRERKVPSRYVRFGVGALSCLATCILLSSAMFGGPKVWREYKERIDVTRGEKFYANQYSLRTVFLQVATSSPAQFLSWPFAPAAIHQGAPQVKLSDFRVRFFLVQMLFTLLVALTLARADDVSAFAMGPLLVFTWVVVNMYYWNMLGFLALGLARRKDRSSFFALLGLHAILALFYLYQHTNHGYAEGYFVALLLCIGLVGFAAAEVVVLWRERFFPAMLLRPKPPSPPP